MNADVTCRACGGGGLQVVLSLGCTPLANAILKPEQLSMPEPSFPLDLAFCPACALVQILETIPPEQLFSEYVYFSSYSTTALDNAKHIVDRTIDTRGLGPQSLAVEIASNDGYLLQYYRDRDVPVLGIEPARNIATVAEERGIPTLNEFFGLQLADRLARKRRASVIHANNVLAHVADLNGFVRGIALLLENDGVAVIEVPYLRDLVERVEFDTIYHEHLCYFSALTLDRLFSRHGLVLADVERISIHGGSLRLFVERAESAHPSERVTALLSEERAAGMDEACFYRSFAGRVERLRADLRAHLQERKARGERLAAYGASAKGATLLNYCGIGTETLDFVVDRNPVKQGCYTPGARLPIYAPEKLLEARPDAVLLLTWNFAPEILEQQQEFRRRGGRFIIPVPEPRVV